MTLYDAILLLRARWPWLVGLPCLALVAAAVAMGLLTIPQYETRAIVQLDPAVPSARVLARIRADGQLTVIPRKSDSQTFEIVAQSAFPEEALRRVRTAIAAVNAEEQTRRLFARRALETALAERRVVMARTDRFAIVDYQILAQRIASLNNGAPGREVALELLGREMVPPPPAINLRTLGIAAFAGFVTAFVGVFLRAWWMAERAARAV